MRRLAFVLAPLLAALAGCGDDGSKSGGSVTVDAGQTVDVKADEYSFDPATITIRAGGGGKPAAVRFRMRNVGSLPHDIHVRAGDDDRGGTEPIGGGETVEGTVTLPPGDYRLFCSIGDHEDLGMRGKLVVR
jgi:plastocyanin